MLEISFGFILSSFIAGLLTFLAPCTLPLVPAYLAFISGVDVLDLENPEKAELARRKILSNGISFVIGFSFVFVVFGVIVGILGGRVAILGIWLTRIGGLFVMIFGIFMLNVFNFKLLGKDRRIPIPKWLELGRPSSSLIIGGTFAFGWTPCVGPILGSILLLASTSTRVFDSALLLAIFSFGLSIPFLLIAVAYSKFTIYLEKIGPYLKWISNIGGVFLIILGALLLTDNFGLMNSYSYELLDFIDYNRLLDFL